MFKVLVFPFLFLAQVLFAVYSLEELSEKYDAFLLDAYGVFWGSREVGVLPGAADGMQYLVSQGKQVGIVSNSTQLAASEKAKFLKHGLQEGVHYHFLITSGDVAKKMLDEKTLPFPTPRKTYWLFGSTHPRFSHSHLFDGTSYREEKNIEKADFIYIPTPHIGGEDQTDLEVFRELVTAVRSDLPVLCANPDRFAQEGVPPRAVVRQGGIASLFAEKGAPVFFTGKPSRGIYEAALLLFAKPLAKEKILMIGDSPETDIRGAHGAGIRAALVKKTGLMAEAIEKEGADAVIRRLSASDQPDHLLERLGLSSPF